MEYPHFKTVFQQRGQTAELKKYRYGRIKPKMVVHAIVALSALFHYLVGFALFPYVAAGYFAWAFYHFLTCGCWKSKVRLASSVFLVMLAFGLLWKPILSLAIATIAFEMFI